MFLLKDKLIDSKQSLVELNNLLDNLTVCGVPEGMDTTNFMTEVTNLKMEAGRLLDEVNHQAEYQDSKTINSLDNIENIFEEFYFKERLNDLKQKIHALSHQEIVLK